MPKPTTFSEVQSIDWRKVTEAVETAEQLSRREGREVREAVVQLADVVQELAHTVRQTLYLLRQESSGFQQAVTAAYADERAHRGAEVVELPRSRKEGRGSREAQG